MGPSKHIATVLVLFVGGCASTQTSDLAYLQKFTNAATYSSLAAEWNSRDSDISQDVRDEIETVFSQEKQSILAPFVPFVRTFDNKEYPEVAVHAYGLPSRNMDGCIVFHITIYATLAPSARRELGRGGMRPLVDESYLAHVVWNSRDKAVRESGISGGQCRALPAESLARALMLASRLNDAYSERSLDRSHAGWLPAWFIKQESSLTNLHTGHNIVILPFVFFGNDMRNTPLHVVFIDLVENRILRVEKQTVDMGPRYERSVYPE